MGFFGPSYLQLVVLDALLLDLVLLSSSSSGLALFGILWLSYLCFVVLDALLYSILLSLSLGLVLLG